MLVRGDVHTIRRSSDRARTRTFEQDLTISPEESTYRVTGGGVVRETYEVTESVTVVRQYGSLRSLGGRPSSPVPCWVCWHWDWDTDEGRSN